jgi:MoaA/NifB/PqqE/SkfB family radical SAM enzyme
MDPLVVAYYVTHRCNLNCAYCEDFGTTRNPQATGAESIQTVRAILPLIREACDSLILTGGEPLLHPQIELIAAYARELRFRHISLLSNGRLIREHASILDNIDRLVISLDTLDLSQWAGMIGAAQETAAQIVENIIWAASLQKELGFRLVVNCVLSPQVLPGVQHLVEFCAKNHILAAFSPQSVHNWPSYEVLVSPDYRQTLLWLMEQKVKGAPVLGSRAYLQTLANLVPYTCHPTIVPRVMPDGSLIYPCRPFEREGGSHGGKIANLVKAGSWKEAVRQSQSVYGLPPETCSSCFQQCYAEPSLMQEKPFEFLIELLSQRGRDLLTFAPG